jgi:hypothetical protein
VAEQLKEVSALALVEPGPLERWQHQNQTVFSDISLSKKMGGSVEDILGKRQNLWHSLRPSEL